METTGPVTKSRLSRIGRHLLALALIVGLLQAFVVLQAKAPVRVLPKVELADYTGFAHYGAGELYGGGSPSEHCGTCDNASIVGSSGGQSVSPDQNVDPATGDFSETDTLFSVAAIGGPRDVTLTYDAQLAQTEASAGSWTGLFGWGWQSDATPSMKITGPDTGTLIVNDENGSEIAFTPADASGGTCPLGDYSDPEKYTVPGSSYSYCAPNRVDAQLEYSTTYGAYQFNRQGGKTNLTFGYLGNIAYQGTGTNTHDLDWNYYSSPSSCSLGIGGTSGCDTITAYVGGTAVGVTQINYNSANEAFFVADLTGSRYWTIGYDSNANLTSITQTATGGGEWQYGYSGGSSPTNHEMTTITNPDGGAAHVGYTTYGGLGMVTSETDETGSNTTTYSYASTSCGTCTGAGQVQKTTVTYPGTSSPREVDVDTYFEGLLTGYSFGSSTVGTAYYKSWTFNYNFPNASNQNGPTTETIVLPGADQQVATETVETDASGNVTSITDTHGNTTTNLYDDSGANNFDELCWSAQPGVSTSGASCSSPPTGSTSYTYDSLGHELSVTDPLGNTTNYGYYSGNGLLCWSAPPGVSISGASCSTPPTGATYYAYDNLGDLTTTQVAFNTSPETTSTSTYDAIGELLSSIAPDGYSFGAVPGTGNTTFQTTYSYYPAGQLETKTTPGSRAETYTYDTAGNVVTETDPTGVTTNAYDVDSRLCWTYRGSSAVGSPSCGTNNANAPSGSTSYLYLADTLAPLSVTDPDGNTTTYAYSDPAYPTQPTMVQSATGKQDFALYDSYGNACLTGPSAPTSTTCAWQSGDTYKIYDASGNVLLSEDPSGKTTTYSYTNAAYPNHVTSETDPLTRTSTFSYDADGNEISSQDPSGNIVTNGYDALGRPCWQAVGYHTNACTSPPTGTGATTFTYDAASNRTQMVDNNGNTSPPTPTAVASPAATSGTVGSLVSAAPSTTASVSAYGSLASHAATGATTLSVTPHAVGDLLALTTVDGSTSITATSVSGGGVTTWTRAEGPYSDGYSNLSLWIGTVTSTGSSTITAAFSGSVSSLWMDFSAQEFSSSAGSSTTWGVDTAAGKTNSSSTTLTYPTLTPAGSGELYFGYAEADNTGSGGSTSGFTYATTTDANVVAYNTSVSSSVTPTAAQSPAGISGAVAALITATGTPGGGIAAVGSPADHDGSGVTTLSVSPRSAGDALVLSTKVPSSSISVSSVSGGGVTTWTKLESYSAYTGHDLELWMGKVTSTGSSTITVSFSGSVSGSDVELVSQEFTAGLGSGTVWTKDTASGQSNASSTTVTFPNLTPARSAEAYIGYASIGSLGKIGSTAGFSYDPTVDEGLFIYNPDLSPPALQETSSYTYDQDGQLLSTTDDNGKTISYQYDAAGDITCIAYPIAVTGCANSPSTSNTVVDRGFDSAGRLTSTTDWLGNEIQFGYSTDGKSNVTSVTYPSTGGESITYGYDAAQNLTSADYAGSVVGTKTQSWTPNADELVGSTSQLSSFSSSNTYDSLNRISVANDPGTTSNPSDTYGYNSNGELASITPPAGSSQSTLFSYDAGSELTLEDNQATGQDTSFAYTAAGERCRQQVSTTSLSLGCNTTPSTATNTDAWDGFGQLCWTAVTTANANCSSPPAGSISYTYNGDGLRMTEAPATGNASTFTWDMVSAGSVPLLVDDGTNAYVYGPLLFGGTAPVEQINLTSNTASYLSSVPSGVQLLFSQGGSLLNQSSYSTFGVATNTVPSSASPFGFQGSYTDATGLVYLINRYYDPATGQFMSVDPMVDTTGQPYAFTGDNPINATDPLGLGLWGWVKNQYHRAEHVVSKGVHAVGHSVRVAAHFVRKHWKAVVTVAVVVVVVVVVTVATVGVGDAAVAAVGAAAEGGAEAAGAGAAAGLGAGAETAGAGAAAATDATATAGVASEGVTTATGEDLAASAARTEPTVVNLGGEGETPGAINQQPQNALESEWGASRTDVAGKSLSELQSMGDPYVVAENTALPFANDSVDQVITNSVPIDTSTPMGSGVQSSEIWRILRAGGEWIHNGEVVPWPE